MPAVWELRTVNDPAAVGRKCVEGAAEVWTLDSTGLFGALQKGQGQDGGVGWL